MLITGRLEVLMRVEPEIDEHDAVIPLTAV